MSGLHQRGCTRARGGIGIGMKRRRTHEQDEHWKTVKTRVVERDRVCQLCASASSLTPHHIETVQHVFARGAGWGEADTIENVMLVCLRCHGMIHSAAWKDEAVRSGVLIC